MRCLAIAFTALMGLSLVPRTATAGELVYRAPAGCPSREAVQQRVDERAPGARPAELTIATGEADRAFVGQAVLGTGEAAVHRRLEGQTCEAVVDAMLLVLALDRPSDRAEGAAPTPPTTTAADVEVKPAITAEMAGASAERDGTASKQPVDPRSSVEVALGTSSIARRLDVRTVFGSELFVEVAAPAALATWYRPSARFGLQHVSEFNWGDDDAAEARLWGAGLELCPLGVAAVSSRHIDLTFSACGVTNFGSATLYQSRLWVDAGGVGRVNVQIGRKGHFRGFVGMDGGVLQRLSDPLLLATDVEPRSENAIPVGLAVPRSDTMWTLALFGGVLFP